MNLEVFVGHRFTQEYMDDFREAIENSLEMFNAPLKPVYADLTLVDGHIFKDRIKHLIDNAFFCIFDITEQDKPNVFIELGYAYGRNKHVVLTSKRVSLPIDLQGYSVLRYSSFKELKTKLNQYLPSILGQALPHEFGKPMATLPRSVTQLIYMNWESNQNTKKSEIYKYMEPSEADNIIEIMEKSLGFLENKNDSIKLTSEGANFFKSMFEK